MALNTYSALKTAIADWLHRSDLAGRIPDFISLAEARINNDISDITLLISSGQIMTVTGQRTYPAPSNFIRLSYATRREPAKTPMQIVSPRSLEEKYAYAQYNSVPDQIAFDGVNLVLHPTPNSTYTIDYTMQDMLTPLSDAAPTNLVLTRFPGLYLYGALMESAPFLMDDARIAVWGTKYAEALTNARSVDYLGDAILRTDISARGHSFNFMSGD